MPPLAARVYEHSHPQSNLVFIVCVFFSLSRLTGIAMFHTAEVFVPFYSYFITCTVALPTTVNTVVLLELLCSTRLSTSTTGPQFLTKNLMGSAIRELWSELDLDLALAWPFSSGWSGANALKQLNKWMFYIFLWWSLVQINHAFYR